MTDYRVFFLGSDGAIEARHDFAAADDGAALQLMTLLADATADMQHGVMLWQGTRRVFERRVPTSGDGHAAHFDTSAVTMLSAECQEKVLDAEETLLGSHWTLARSRTLLQAVDAMRRARLAPKP